MKINSKKIFLFLTFVIFSSASFAYSMELNSTNFSIKDPIIGTLGGYGSSTNFGLLSSGHTTLSDIGGTSASFKIRYGFLYYDDAAPGTITFDIDTETGGGNGESSSPYAVGLGTITTTDTRVSGTTDGVQMVTLEGEATASGGMVVTVKNSNGSNGMVSTSNLSSNINSADGAMLDGTENYGLCVATAGLSGFSRASPYSSGSCATNTETNDIQGLTSTGENLLNTGGTTMTGGHAEVIVNAAISAVTPAHTDYADTLTFIATGTY